MRNMSWSEDEEFLDAFEESLDDSFFGATPSKQLGEKARARRGDNYSRYDSR